MHKSTENQLLVYLAVTVWISCLTNFTTITLDLYPVTFTSNVACKLMSFGNVSAISSSLVMVFILTIDRFFTVYEPFQTWKLTPLRCKLFTAGLFALTCGSSIPHLFMAEVKEIDLQIIEANVTFKGHQCEITVTGDFCWLSTASYIVKIVDVALILQAPS
ncbi:hypothetical protein DPMN_148941 [Dreissena polymorpha]|uniref:G-protein coupled receptors family 1 profile domain-containing protein n=1 Tax=Dreissena polymorpha TaxID=45954 RepID=A0A9D4FCQ7_DREPO|nr:hypothetical protein DPMN_148906 [Dreissena polymorpha]KAH3795391.1 hypothetical protein DPMN_148941 [Dreissena polymorpha]